MNDNWLQTHTGVAFELDAPTADMVRAYDIAFALSHQSRFFGHAGPYSVGQHCLLVCNRVAQATDDRDLALAALLHDAAEAYCGDIASPLKRMLGSVYREIEDRVARAIAEAFGFDSALLKHPLIVEADLRALATEARDLMVAPPKDWGLPAQAVPYESVIVPLGSDVVRMAYMRKLERLMS
jgi:uncharacterized protein